MSISSNRNPEHASSSASRACFSRGIVVGIEVVDTDHPVPIRQQAAGDMHADEPGRAGD